VQPKLLAGSRVADHDEVPGLTQPDTRRGVCCGQHPSQDRAIDGLAGELGPHITSRMNGFVEVDRQTVAGPNAIRAH
jgi:hypothetical protein